MHISIGNHTKEAMKILNIKEWPFTETELKKHYRELAKIHHSDKGGSDEKMKKINEAYDQLKNLAKTDITEQDSIEEEIKFKKKTETDMFTVYETCKACEGKGWINKEIITGYKHLTCMYCFGSKKTTIKNMLCKDCKGTGKFKQRNGRIVSCRKCKGTGIYEIQAKCMFCMGTGKQLIPVYETTKNLCSTCKGIGKVELNLWNPVIPKGAIL